jgi:hypothetical protein
VCYLSHSKTVHKKRTAVCEYQIFWHDLVAFDSLRDALKTLRLILPDLEKLSEWEKEGKVRAECMGCSPFGTQRIEVLDKSVESQLRKVKIVDCYDVDEEAEKIETRREEGQKESHQQRARDRVK